MEEGATSNAGSSPPKFVGSINLHKDITNMMRSAVLSMMMVMVSLSSSDSWAAAQSMERTKTMEKQGVVVALDSSEREEATLAATLFVEMADRGMYEELWLRMTQEFRESNDYRNFEKIFAYRRKSLVPVDDRKLVSLEAIDAIAPDLVRARFALAIFCTRSEGIMFYEAIVMVQKAGREWFPEQYRFEFGESNVRDSMNDVTVLDRPCAHLTEGDTQA